MVNSKDVDQKASIILEGKNLTNKKPYLGVTLKSDGGII